MRSKKALYNIVSNLLLQAIIVIYGFVVPKILIEKFGSDTNGLIASITQFLAYISLLESGFCPVVKSMLYRPIANKDKKSIASILKTAEKFFRKIAVIFILYIVALFFIYPLVINKDFSASFTVPMIAIIGLSTFAEYFFGMTYRLYLQAEQKTYVVSIIQILTYILSIILIVILAVIGANVFVIKLVSGLVFVLRPLLQNLYVKKKFSIDFSEASSNYVIKQKWDGLAQHIAAVIHSNTDVVVLTIFCVLSEVSVYSVYYLVVAGVRKMIQAFNVGIDSSFGDMLARDENEKLTRSFSSYECLYYTVATVVFACTFVLITPFVEVYTMGITDADYIRPLFGIILTLSEYIWIIRLPYSSIISAAGHFKQTRIGAWIECFANIVISVILVRAFGIVGVAIGTTIAMAIRTIEFIYHTNKKIFRRSIFRSARNVLLSVFELVLIAVISNYLPFLNNDSYLHWGINAVMTFVLSASIVGITNIIVYKREFKDITGLIKRFLRKRK